MTTQCSNYGALENGICQCPSGFGYVVQVPAFRHLGKPSILTPKLRMSIITLCPALAVLLLHPEDPTAPRSYATTR